MNKKIAKLYDDGQIDSAIHLLINEIDESPQNVDNYLQLSMYLIEQNSAQQALELLKKGQRLVNEPEELNYNLAVSYYVLGEFGKSLKIINNLPDNDAILYQKALIFQKLGQFQKALAFAMTIKKPDNKEFELLGDIWMSLGDLVQAHSYFKKITDHDRSAKVNFLLGITIFDTEPKKAKEYLNISQKQDSTYFKHAQEQYMSLVKMIRGKKDAN